MRYEKPKAQIVLFDNSDVITASGCSSQASSFVDDICPRELLVVFSCLFSGYNRSKRQNKNENNPAGPSNDPFGNI